MKKFLKILKSRKGDISLIGIIITITVAVFIQGYLDTMSANYILDEAQSMVDLTALTTLQSSVDTEGLRYERMTIRPYNYDYEKYHVNQSQNGEGNSFSNSLLTGNANGWTDDSGVFHPYSKEQAEIANYSIWLDGTNAYYIEHSRETAISERMRENFDYYMQNFLWNQLAADGVNIKSYKVAAFSGTLSYDNWGINRKYHIDTVTYEGKNNTACNKTTNDYIKMPQATIDATIQLEVDIDQTFTSGAYQLAMYNALKTSENAGVNNLLEENSNQNNYTFHEGTYLVDSGFNDDGNLVLTIRVLARQTFY